MECGRQNLAGAAQSAAAGPDDLTATGRGSDEMHRAAVRMDGAPLGARPIMRSSDLAEQNRSYSDPVDLRDLRDFSKEKKRAPWWLTKRGWQAAKTSSTDVRDPVLRKPFLAAIVAFYSLVCITGLIAFIATIWVRSLPANTVERMLRLARFRAGREGGDYKDGQPPPWEVDDALRTCLYGQRLVETRKRFMPEAETEAVKEWLLAGHPLVTDKPNPAIFKGVKGFVVQFNAAGWAALRAHPHTNALARPLEAMRDPSCNTFLLDVIVAEGMEPKPAPAARLVSRHRITPYDVIWLYAHIFLSILW